MCIRDSAIDKQGENEYNNDAHEQQAAADAGDLLNLRVALFGWLPSHAGHSEPTYSAGAGQMLLISPTTQLRPHSAILENRATSELNPARAGHAHDRLKQQIDGQDEDGMQQGNGQQPGPAGGRQPMPQ